MTMMKTVLMTAMLGLAAPVLANAHMEAKKDAAGKPMDHGADHKMDTSKMSAADKAAHDKMMADAAKAEAAAAADKAATPK